MGLIGLRVVGRVEARTEGKVGGEPRPELVNKDDRELAWARATTRADE